MDRVVSCLEFPLWTLVKRHLRGQAQELQAHAHILGMFGSNAALWQAGEQDWYMLGRNRCRRLAAKAHRVWP